MSKKIKNSTMKKVVTNLNDPKVMLLILIIVLGLLLRLLNVREVFVYGHDHDLSAWIVRDIIENKHLRLIGQETSTQGFFIGPLYYYAQVPFYWVTKMDPIAQVYTSVLIGVFGIISANFIFKRIFSETSGFIASFIYAVSFFTVANDKEAVPTVPVIIWSIWFLYALYQLINGKQKIALILLGILLGLIWHLNVALAVVLPLIPITYFLSPQKKIDFRSLSYGIVITLILLLPFLVFEVRHNFIQLKALFFSLDVGQSDIYFGVDRLVRILYIVNKNISAFIWRNNNFLSSTFLSLIFLAGGMLFITVKKVITKKLAVILSLWLVFFIVFFFNIQKPISEYYLNGLFAVYLLVFVEFLRLICRAKLGKLAVLVFLLIFGYFNVLRVITSYGRSQTRYIDKTRLTQEIKNDSAAKGYPCVAVSYITDPGYELGFRYFYYLADLKLTPIRSNVPVYTIIYPLGKDTVKEDLRIGYLGLIYPKTADVNYNKLAEVCQAEDYNQTQPMFGFNP
jgi:4-amino-4-deoxy-L-arabinose transferase-like glycosyltransferase